MKYSLLKPFKSPKRALPRAVSLDLRGTGPMGFDLKYIDPATPAPGAGSRFVKGTALELLQGQKKRPQDAAAAADSGARQG